ncbi:MAG TPA: helix-hairpin-helix domain-containing protein [Patescibacteria group bacterium]
MDIANINWQEVEQKYRLQIILLIIGFILLGLGIFLTKNDFFAPTKIEILDPKVEGASNQQSEMIVEINGAVEKPGVYHLPSLSRIEDLLIISGGLSVDADRELVNKNINRAAKLIDGQKVYIPSLNEQSNPSTASKTIGGSNVAQYDNTPYSNLVNINEATLNELDTLPGIGPVYAQKIIDNRPYSNTSELVSKKVLTQSVFDKIKDKISVY